MQADSNIDQDNMNTLKKSSFSPVVGENQSARAPRPWITLSTTQRVGGETDTQGFLGLQSILTPGVTDSTPEAADSADKRERGRPSKISAAARARLFGIPDELVPVSLMKTTNYDQFIIPTGVAEPLPAEVERFAERLDLHNNLQWNPIRVTPYLEVYDGKLRLAAARLRGFALAYVVDETLSVGDIVADRGEPRGWEFDQYCLYYAEQGRPVYARLLAFSKEHNLPLGSAISLLSGGGTQLTEAVLHGFKRGQFRITHEAHARAVVSVRDEYRRKIPVGPAKKKDVAQQRVFLNAVSTHLAQPGVTASSLSAILPVIRWQPTEADYERHLGRLLREAKAVTR